jgi:hypothetical protein
VRGSASSSPVAGLITWFTSYIGPDDRFQITLGIVVTGFGITWWILGVILHRLEGDP